MPAKKKTSKNGLLTDKQKAFCREYLVDFNATHAAVRAGYKKDNANEMGAENLAKAVIQNEIKKLLDKRIERTEVKQDKVLLELAKIAFSNIGNFVEKTKDGINIKDFKGVDTSLISEIQEHKKILKTIDSKNKKGNKQEVIEIKSRIKMYDKTKALELIGRHLAMFTDKIQHSGNLTKLSSKETEDLYLAIHKK